ncbi:MAG: hypothetical protein OSJ58_22245, partial [Dysosmobacter sp.]|nr:hypothetical protein [Dysosmobacter sp.]
PAEGHAEQQENDVASVTIDGTTTYVGNLDDAFKKENDSATITLLKDIERTGPLNIEINCTLNLGGYKISSSSGVCIRIREGANVIIEGEGEVISENSRALWVEGSATLEGGTFTSRNHNAPSVYVNGNETTTTLSVTGKNVVIREPTGSGIGLKVWQAKSIQLSSGTYSGWRAIDLTSGFFTLDQLLGHSGDTRYAYFDKNGELLTGKLNDQSLTGTVTVGECMHDKSVCEYTPNEGVETHAMNCLACGLAEAAADCTYSDDYGHDETNHWQTCTLCGGKKTETHSWGYLWASTTSTIRRSCDKCEIGTAVGTVSVTPGFSVAYGETGSATLACTAELADGYSLEPADSAD